MPRYEFTTFGITEPIGVHLTSGGDTAPWSSEVDGRRSTPEVVRTNADGGWLRLDGRIVPFRAIRRNGVVHVWVDGETVTFDIVSRTAKRSAGAAGAGGSGQVLAPMPGRILSVNVAPGETVEVGAAIVIMESMKMEMTIEAPQSGVVGVLQCSEGDLVEMGALLLEVRAAESEDA